jgi:hypothetical protein
MLGLSLIQLYELPVPVKLTAVVTDPLHTVWLVGKVTVESAFTVATTAVRLAVIQPDDVAST